MEKQRDLRTALFNLPKIDLHRHLEGSLRLSTLAEIAQEHAVDLPSWSLDELRPYVQVVDGDPYDFQGFLAKFKLLRRFYSSREAVLRVTSEAIADAAADNVRYLELRFNPVALGHNQGFSFEDVTDWVIEATDEAQKKHNIQVRLIVQIGRHEPQYARQLAEIAVSRQHRGIVALDLAGDEITYSAAKFIQVFRWAKAQGLHITVHAAEAGPATNVIEAIKELGAERIGHGVRARDNDKVIELLRSQRTTLEMCPTSNLQTGIIPKFSQHPLFAFHQLGIPVTVNTDDPSISNTTLTDEFLVANRGIGVPFRDLRQMTLNAAEAAFLPEPEKKRLLDWFRNWFERIPGKIFVQPPAPPGL
ncbi:MAG: adenosine deaminase [Anaerolineales bacterium]|nr:adenosine deaminase [Anaerolineales bacterium]